MTQELAPADAVTGYMSIRTTDNTVHEAIAYLQSLGAPENPTLKDDVVVFPGGSYTNSTVTFVDHEGRSVTVIAGLMAMYPNVTATDLARAKIITLPVGFAGNVPAPYQLAHVTITTPTPLPSSPIGVPMFPNNTMIGATFYQSPSDHFPFGQIWKENKMTYRKDGSLTPFGPSAFWTRIA